MADVQSKNQDLVGLLSPDFQLRNEPNFSLANAVSTFQMLPELRAFWPFSAINESGNILDLSGQGRTLTNNGTTPRATTGLVNYAGLNGSTRYFSRASEAGLAVTAGLTFGGWFYPTVTGSNVMAFCKDGAAGNLAYHLQRLSTDKHRLQISSDGTASTYVDTASAWAINGWYFIAGRFSPSSSIKIWTNYETAINTTSIPASIFSGTGALNIGRWDGGASRYWGGRVALCFLCAAPVPDAIINNLFEQTRGLFGV